MTKLARTAAVLLAAGRSQRHPGQNKLCRVLDGRPLGLHAAQTIATLAPCAMIAVCSKNTQDLAEELAAIDFEVNWNDDPGKGLSSSLKFGVQAALRHDVDAILICLADMPFVSLGHLRTLVAKLDFPSGVTIVGSRANDTDNAMPPAVFSREMLDHLLSLEGDSGARELLRHAVSVQVSSKELADFDDPKAFEKFSPSRASSLS